MIKKTVLLAALLWGQVAGAQTTIDLPIDQATQIATQAALAGDADVALGIADAVLAVAPDNRAALLVLAAAGPLAGRAADARRAGARAWRLSQTPAQRYEAARLTALAAANQQRFTLASYWLRLALVAAPNPAERARTLQDAATVARANPWQTQLSFSLVPSNNVNGGSDDAGDGSGGVFSLDAQALEGVRGSFGVNTRYRLHETAQRRVTIGLNLQSTRVNLVDEGKPVFPGSTTVIRNDDFATDQAELSLSYEQVLSNGLISATLAAGRLRYGFAPYYDYQSARLARTVKWGDNTSFQLAARREVYDYVSTGIDETRRTTLTAALSHTLGNGDEVTAALANLRSDSPASNYVFEEWSLRGSYSWADPIGPFQLTAHAGLKEAIYPDYRILFTSIERSDQTFTYGLDIGLPDLSYAGFTPEISISGSSANSNVSRFTRDSLSMGFTLKSQF